MTINVDDCYYSEDMGKLIGDLDVRSEMRMPACYVEKLLKQSVRGKRHADGTVVITAVMMYVPSVDAYAEA